MQVRVHGSDETEALPTSSEKPLEQQAASAESEELQIVHAHHPESLKNTIALKALFVKFLKNYIVMRLELWKSTTHAIVESLSGWAFTLTFGILGSNKTYEDIVDDCSALKSDIEKANKYEDYIALIEKLLTKITAAKKKPEMIKKVTSEEHRGLLYYSLISLIHEILKIEYPPRYKKHVATLRAQYNTAYADYRKLFRNQECEAIINTCNTLAYELIKIGDRESYFNAFQWGFNPNSDIFVREPQAKGLAYLGKKKVDKIALIINNQMREEQGGEVPLTGDLHPNANLPLYCQPDLEMYYSYKHLKQGLNFATKCALKTYQEEINKSFRTIILLNPEQFVAENRPEDVEAKSRKDKNRNEADVKKVRYSPVDSDDEKSEKKKKQDKQADRKPVASTSSQSVANNNNMVSDSTQTAPLNSVLPVPHIVTESAPSSPEKVDNTSTSSEQLGSGDESGSPSKEDLSSADTSLDDIAVPAPPVAVDDAPPSQAEAIDHEKSNTNTTVVNNGLFANPDSKATAPMTSSQRKREKTARRTARAAQQAEETSVGEQTTQQTSSPGSKGK